MISIRHTHSLVALCLLGLVLGDGAACAFADPILTFQETWDATDSGWIDRDTSEMQVGWTGFGNPGGGLSGSYSSQSISFPQFDAFRATDVSSGGAFTGDYFAGGLEPHSWTFDFFSDDVEPASLLVIFTGNGNQYFRSVTSELSSTQVWDTVTVPLDSSTGWGGDDPSGFNAALGDVDTIDIQVQRSGSGPQNFYVDNFSFYQVVPEPASMALFILGAVGLRWTVRRRR